MDIVKICAVGIITAFCVLILKEHNSQAALITGIAGGCLIILSVIEGFTQVFSTLSAVAEKTGIPSHIYKIAMKIIGIGYLTDFSAGIVEDTGQKALADKLVFCGKIIIMAVSLPVITLLFNTIAEIVQ